MESPNTKRRKLPNERTDPIDHFNNNSNRISQSMVQLPSIPGVPVEHIPLFLESLKSTSKFLQARTKIDKESPFAILDWEGVLSTTENPINHSSMETPTTTHDSTNDSFVHDALMKRIDVAAAAAATTVSSELQTVLTNRRRKFVQVTTRWLQDLRSLARRKKGQATTASVPYSIFLYLWELQHEHKKVNAKRAALFLSGLLLARSQECRNHLDQEKNLADWVNLVVTDTTNEWRLLQNEAIHLISFLLNKGYGKIYPKLGVAAKCLKHRSSILCEISETNSRGMVDWRRVRDIALQHGRKEIEKVERLLEKAENVFLLLVPRFEQPSNPQQVFSEDDDSSEDDDVDWEDGDGATEESHRSAVERTMAAMEQTSALGRCGGLQIDFDRTHEDDPVDKTANHDKARERLQKIVVKLSRKHLIRLTAWLDALRNADGLRQNFETKLVSLVSLTSVENRLRLELIQSLSKLKEDISRVLSSATRLNIVDPSNEIQQSRSTTTLQDNKTSYQRGPSRVPSQRNGDRKRKKHPGFRKIEISLNR